MTDLSLVPLDDSPYGRPAAESGVSVSEGPMQQHMGLGVGAHEGAERTSRELGSWNPSLRSPDADINRDKQVLDARGRDLVRNTGYMRGAVSIHRDSIVGSQFRLNAKPDHRVLGLDETWAEEFQIEVESKFSLYAEAEENWLDASQMNSLTSMVRLGIGMFFFTGEVLASMEWMPRRGRPYRTAMQMIDPDRLSNPNDVADSATLRRGIERDSYGAPIAAHIRFQHPNDVALGVDRYKWQRVPIRKPWGRLMLLHIIEQLRPDQTRGVAEMTSVLKEMRMTSKFHDVTLQNAVVNATFAAAIESDLPSELAFQSLGYGDQVTPWAASYLAQIAEYNSGGRNLQIDGARIPHLYPGTKLKLLSPGTPGGVGDRFEESLLRNVASALGLSYEQFSRDYTKTNYSSARASMNETWKYMQGRKKSVADRIANAAYSCWLEEAINSGEITSMPANAPSFYEGLNKAAYCKANWIGASRGQVDEMKETQAAVLRMSSGLSTLEIECAKLGEDYRDILIQKLREKKMMEAMGLDFNSAPTKPGTNSAHRADNTDNTDTANSQEDNANA